MARKKTNLTDSWPGIKSDLQAFLADTDAWVIAALKEARTARDWSRIDKIIAVMDMVHNLSHGH